MAGAITGAMLGGLGGLVAVTTRISLASVLALGYLGLGIWHLYGEHPRLLERDCETAQQWMELGPVRWALVNGLALGVGFTSRIGFVTWYVVPIAALLSGQIALGAAIFGAYGATRGLAVWGWFAVMSIRPTLSQGDIAAHLFERYPDAKLASAGLLVLISVMVEIVVGV